MKALSGLALIALSLTVAACGKKDEGSVTSAEPIAAVAAPAGTKWSETIAASPDGYFVMGNPNAKVKLVEYGSYTCSHCRVPIGPQDVSWRRPRDPERLTPLVR